MNDKVENYVVSNDAPDRAQGNGLIDADSDHMAQLLKVLAGHTPGGDMHILVQLATIFSFPSSSFFTMCSSPPCMSFIIDDIA